MHDMTADNKCARERHRPTVAVQLSSISERAIGLHAVASQVAPRRLGGLDGSRSGEYRREHRYGSEGFVFLHNQSALHMVLQWCSPH